ncbi:MAG: acetyl-CoA carboxylase biotin carboxylase subunit [Deferrisomatales bacterium]
MFQKVLIANRGEIAVRVLRACRELGIRSVAVYSDADREALHVRWADEAFHVGPSLSRKSYLDAERILTAAQRTGADAVHPGYGFLAENAAFAAACADRGLVFVGPPARAIELAGDKARARRTMEELGVPVIPGSAGVVEDAETAAAAAAKVGYPVILKAAGGGGGRGLRIARDEGQLRDAFRVAGGEAGASCGNPALYLEKYLESPRHIEVQILADRHGAAIHLGERECSIQKRYQKLLEEAPSPFVDEDLRRRLGGTAVRAARGIGYVNAGTMEFLVDRDRNFYFMEVNARIQVEHPVTELVTGVDLVQAQLRIAAGEPLGLAQEDVCLRGWAIECRINAADPEEDFLPSPGEIEALHLPSGPGVRVDTHLFRGALVPPFYDSLVAKLAVWAPDRDGAIRRMQRALGELRIDGIRTTAGFHQRLLASPAFQAGELDTHFLDRL